MPLDVVRGFGTGTTRARRSQGRSAGCRNIGGRV